jgi:LysR family transcriptional regulator, glycine cleavage system transcriptional activator
MRTENVKSPPIAKSINTISRQELPKLEFLRSFEAAARTLSFTVAANELFLTQSAVSRQMQQLEESIGTPLFFRQHRALALTEAGRTLQRAVVDSLERLRDATLVIRASQQASSDLRQVAVTCTPGFASLWLIPRLARFTASHPHVDVRISATYEVQDINRAQLDFAIRFNPIHASDSIGEPLFTETMQPVCSPILLTQSPHPLKTPADLVHHTLLMVDYAEPIFVSEDWDPWLKLMSFNQVKHKNMVRFSQYADAVSAAVAGQGVVIGRFPLIDSLMHDGRLVAPFSAHSGGHSGLAESQRAYFLTMGARAAINPDAQDFAAWLRQEAITS